VIETMSKAIIVALGTALIALGASGLAWSEHDDHHRGDQHKSGGLAPVTNERYRTECGGCHFAYPAGLMTAASWDKVMNTLDQHFGDDASLDTGLEPTVKTELLAYLQANAADRSDARRARSFAAGKITGDGPPRITRNSYFRRKHDEVPVRYVKDNPQVKSFSHCSACHRGADKGIFDEHDVDIPGYGPFED
jgi:hypothetical protein